MRRHLIWQSSYATIILSKQKYSYFKELIVASLYNNNVQLHHIIIIIIMTHYYISLKCKKLWTRKNWPLFNIT